MIVLSQPVTFINLFVCNCKRSHLKSSVHNLADKHASFYNHPQVLSMIYPFTLEQISLALGLFYIISHGFALLQPDFCQKTLLAAPRNYPLGVILMALATAWFTWLMLTIDLMEYTPYQKIFALVGLIGGALVIYFLRELLTGRALGSLLLLLSYVVLDAAFLRNEPLKLVLVGTAYIYIVVGMILVSSPYRLRDILQWIYQKKARSQVAAAAGILFGILLLILGLIAF
jgi:hypothetical protein